MVVGRSTGLFLSILIVFNVARTFPPSALATCEARDLTDVLQQGLTADFPTFQLNTGEFARHIAPAFTGAISLAITQQLPLAAVAPAFAYRYNPAVDIFERSTNVPGPLFSERALSLGKGRLNISVGYAFVDFRELNGTNLDESASSGLILDPSPKEAVRYTGGRVPVCCFVAPVVLSMLRTQIDLQAHLVVPIGLPKSLCNLQINPRDPTILDASASSFSQATTNGLYKSTDSGVTWTFSVPGADCNLAIAPNTPMTLYTAGLPTGPEGTVVQDGEIIMKSIDGGVTWSPMNNYPFLNIGKLLVDPINPEILYVLGDFSESRNVSRVYKSIDSGTTFSPINEGLPVASFLLSDVEIDPHNPSILYTTTFGNGVFVLEQQ